MTMSIFKVYEKVMPGFAAVFSYPKLVAMFTVWGSLIGVGLASGLARQQVP